MSLAELLQKDFEKKEEVPKKEPMHYLKLTIKKAKQYCLDNRQDWVVLVVGNEGSGKSTLSYHVARLFDPDFDLHESMIYSFRGEEHSFLGFMKNFKDTPYKVAWYDEAVTVLFSLRHSSKDVADAQEIFKIKRDCRHFDILTTPSFWDLVPDIRERRSKSLLYCFTEVYHPTQNRTLYRHKYAYFSGEKIIKLSLDNKAKYAFRSARELFKIVKPDFIEEFPDMDEEFKGEYLASKRANRNTVLDRIEGRSEDVGAEKLLVSTVFDLTDLKKDLLKIATEADPNFAKAGG